VTHIVPSSLRANSHRLLGVLALAVLLGGCGEKLSREDFVTKVKDKTTSDVQAAVGKPDNIDQSTPGTIKWMYESKTFNTGDAATKLDKKTIVVFQQRDPSSPATVADVMYD
jgi:hypothetical protein